MPVNLQRVAPPNINVQTNTASPQGTKRGWPPTSAKVTLNKSQFYQPKEKQRQLPSDGLQHIKHGTSSVVSNKQIYLISGSFL